MPKIITTETGKVFRGTGSIDMDKRINEGKTVIFEKRDAAKEYSLENRTYYYPLDFSVKKRGIKRGVEISGYACPR